MHLAERPLSDKDYEYIMTHSLSPNLPHFGLFGEIHERFNKYLLHPRLDAMDMKREYEKRGMVQEYERSRRKQKTTRNK